VRSRLCNAASLGAAPFDILVRNEIAHVIFRGLNGRRQEADFGDEPIDVKIHANEGIVEFCIELTGDRWLFGKNSFALLSLPKHKFSEAVASHAKNAGRRLRQKMVRESDRRHSTHYGYASRRIECRESTYCGRCGSRAANGASGGKRTLPSDSRAVAFQPRLSLGANFRELPATPAPAATPWPPSGRACRSPR
jgi:hypothetical protein